MRHYDNLTNLKGVISPSTLSWDFKVEGVQRFEYGKNGMMAFYSNNHIYMDEVRGWDVRGETNMPGVLASASVATNRGQANGWGAKFNSNSVTAISGGFRVPLKEMEHGNYTVQITPHTKVTFSVTNKTQTSFDVMITGAFDYTVVGSNY